MRHFLLAIVIVLVIAMGLSSCLCQPRYASFANDKSCLTSNPMHIDFTKKNYPCTLKQGVWVGLTT